MSTELIINASLPETRIALMESGEIQDLLIERASGKGITGNIYKGRVTRVLPGMQAAFVDIGLEKAAFLYVDDVYVHSEIFEEEEESAVAESAKVLAEVSGAEGSESGDAGEAGESGEAGTEASDVAEGEEGDLDEHDGAEESGSEDPGFEDEHEESAEESPEESEDSDESGDPVEMSAGPDGGDDDDAGNRSDAPSSQPHPGTVGPSEGQSSEGGQSAEGAQSGGSEGEAQAGAGSGSGGAPGEGGRRRHRRGRRGGRFRNRRDRDSGSAGGERERQERRPSGGTAGGEGSGGGEYSETFQQHVSDTGESSSDRADLSGEASPEPTSADTGERRPTVDRQAFRSQRSKDRRIPARGRSRRPIRAQVNIQDLLKEGQEVIVQVAKDPIATKGARLTCHISLPGRHLVCMPTIDHVGVSRRIERDDERRRLRDIVERNRPRNLGFIVRTASGRGQAEARIRQDIDYLTHLWGEIKEKAAAVTAPALVYEDLNSVLRCIRDWVTEDIDKIIVDSRYHYNDIQRFVSHFMPSLKSKVELYHGDIPIFDAYNISTELSRAMERKVWLKSGGYLVIDQAEALVAIDVNTGRYVGKKNLEDTILKTNLEAVQEIAYQLRLRNCGGIIILDLIDMEKEENKQRVYRALEEALKRDRARPTIIKISELGLVEMTRKRTRDTIVRSLCESCSHCEGKGFIKSKVTVAYEVLREIEREVIERDVSKILIQANPDVIDILAIDERETLDQIERRYRKQIYLQSVTDFHQEQFEVAGDKKPGKQAGEFAEVVQPLRGAAAERGDRGDRGHERHDRGHDRDRGERDRGRRGRRDRGRGRDRNTDRGRDRDRDQGAPIQAGGQQGPIQPLIQAEDSYAASGEAGQNQSPDFSSAENMGSAYEPGTGQESATPREHDENFGNATQPLAGGDSQPQGGQGGSGGQGSPGSSPGSEDDDDFFENEEDRLAFLRAQAAQDAALARLSNGGAPGHHGRGGGMSGGRGGHGTGTGGGGAGGGRNDRSGRRRRGRGGSGSGRNDKFRGGRDHRSFSGPGGHGGSRGGHGGSHGGGVSGGSQGGGPSGGGSTGGGGSPAGGSEGGSAPGGDFGGGGSTGGGGDRSSPPGV